MYQKAQIKVNEIPQLISVYRGDLKLVPGETPVFHYIDQRNRNADSLAMIEKAEELLKGILELKSDEA